MKILYHVPHLNIRSAYRNIYNGYKNAFTTLGHDFKFLTAQDNQSNTIKNHNPDIFFTALIPYFIKFLDVDSVKSQRKSNMKVFVRLPFWNSPLSKLRLNETPSLKDLTELVKLITSDEFGDEYYSTCREEDPRMKGFEGKTGHTYHTVLLAADPSIHFPDYAKDFKADISFVGSNLPDKRTFFNDHVYPLEKHYDLKLYGQDWTLEDKVTGLIQKAGQYFDLPLLKNIKKPQLKLEDERKIYTSSTISINVHEQYQREFSGDFNERTFKIPMCGGFQICDNVELIKQYLIPDKEIVLAKNKDEWFDKIEYYIKNPKKRLPIIKAGQKKVSKEHTYINRAQQFIDIYNGNNG